MEWTEYPRKVLGQQNLWITTNFSRFIALKIAAVKMEASVVTVKARAATIVTSAGVVVKIVGQIKARELLCQANEAKAAELIKTKTCGRPVRCN